MGKRPWDLLIYYGWLSSYNSDVNGWVLEKVAQDLAKYDILVLGNGLQDPSHGDYANTQIVIPRIKTLSRAMVFGYVQTDLSMADFKEKVNQWDAMGIDGIFMDRAGYDYGTTRDEFNARLLHIKSKTSANLCFVNAWNMNHVIGTVDDPSFPNATLNPDLHESVMSEDDWYLLESFSVNTEAYPGGYSSEADWLNRATLVSELIQDQPVHVASVGIINNDNAHGQQMFNFSYHSSLIFNFDANGTSDTSYGASSAKIKMWPRPKPVNLPGTEDNELIADAQNPQVFLRYGEQGRIKIDHSTHTSTIESW